MSDHLQVFYDASCRLCATEMQQLKQLDHDDWLELIDCSAAAFDDAPYRAAGVTRAAMLDALHVREPGGGWHVGVDAFGLLYGTLGLDAIATAWTHPLSRRFTERAYPWIVRHRHALSRLGLHRLAPWLSSLAAHHAARRPRCSAGDCTRHAAPAPGRVL
jgi:predicted DCC family thiol-disulfide oxidoreductase YuxK